MSGEDPGGEITVASKADAAPTETESTLPPVPGDRDLLVAYASGDEAAFETLAAKYSRMLYGVAFRYVGDPQLAEETVQSTFIILARKAGTFSKDASVCGWLLRTTRFVARDALKMLRRREVKESEFRASSDAAATASADETAMASLVEEALLGLAAAEHDCLVARFYEHKSFKEIAASFGISEDAAQKRVSRSLGKVRAFLERRGIKASVAIIPGALAALWSGESSAHAAQTLAQTALALAKGKTAVGKAAALAQHALRSWWWRSTLTVCLRLGLPAVLLLAGAWAAWEWNQFRGGLTVSDPRIESLARAWAQIDLRVARDRQQFLPTAPTDPRFQQVVREANAIVAETARIAASVAPLLTPANERARTAEFLTVELRETLRLNANQQLALFSWMGQRLAQGATLRGALTNMAQSTPTEAAEIRTMLSPAQRRVFDRTYGANGLGLFTYAKTVISGK